MSSNSESINFNGREDAPSAMLPGKNGIFPIIFPINFLDFPAGKLPGIPPGLTFDGNLR